MKRKNISKKLVYLLTKKKKRVWLYKFCQRKEGARSQTRIIVIFFYRRDDVTAVVAIRREKVF